MNTTTTKTGTINSAPPSSTSKLTAGQVALFARVLSGYKPQPGDGAEFGTWLGVAVTLAAMPDWERTETAFDTFTKAGLSKADVERIYRLTSTPQDLAAINGLCVRRGGELFDKQFSPLQFVLDGLIARGNCVLIAGRPKSGKSWFTVQLAQAIDTGTEFLGRKTTKSRVLYLALEDGERRINQRLHIRKWRPENTDFAFSVLPFDDGAGIEQIRATAAGYDVIIIDTLIKCLTAKVDESNNTAMAEIMNGLADIAHKTEKAFVIVHHTRKGDSDDPFELIRGAGAIRGAYDIGIVIQRKAKEAEAVLNVESRDIEADNMTISFDTARGWVYAGNGGEIENLRVGREIVKALGILGDDATVKELADHLKISEQAVHSQLTTAQKRGLVISRPDPNAKGFNRKPAHLWSRTETAIKQQGGSPQFS